MSLPWPPLSPATRTAFDNGRGQRPSSTIGLSTHPNYRACVPFILLTNDDGIGAVGLPSFAEALSRIGDVEVLVPDRERSWVGKALTRFEPIEVKQVDVGGRVMRTATGYPADCVQLGIHMLFDRRPDVLVSGVNVGYNHGAAYLQSSGTVGAALEGAIAGVPSIAFSMGTVGGDWNEWKTWAESASSTPTWSRIADLAASMVELLLACGVPGAISVGLPETAGPETERRVTTVARVGYDRLFSKTDADTYRHTFGGLAPTDADMAGTDIEAAASEVVAITPIDGAGYGETSRPLAEALR